jgi:hypothetical protein
VRRLPWLSCPSLGPRMISSHWTTRDVDFSENKLQDTFSVVLSTLHSMALALFPECAS